MPRPRRKNVDYAPKQETRSNSDSDFEVNTTSKKSVKQVMRDSDEEESVDEDSDYEKQRDDDDEEEDDDDGDQQDDENYDDDDDDSDSVVPKTRAGKPKSRKAVTETVVTYSNKIGVQTGLICRPNLSDEDSSSSSDDEIPISKQSSKNNATGTQNKFIETSIFVPAGSEPNNINKDYSKVGASEPLADPSKHEGVIPLQNISEEDSKEGKTDSNLRNSDNSLGLNVENKTYESVIGEPPKMKSRRKLSSSKEKAFDDVMELQDPSKTNQNQLKRVRSHEETDGVHKTKTQKLSKAETFSSGEEDWEEVDEVKLKLPSKKKKIKEEEEAKPPMEIKDVQISVGVQSIHKKKKTKEEKMFLWLRQLFGRIQRQRQLLVHKCHLLCLLTRALQQNTLCNMDNHKGLCLSLIPSNFHKTLPSRWNITDLRQFLTWFQKEIPTVGELLLYIDKDASKMKNLSRVHIFVMMLRSLGFTTRLVHSLQPCPSKVKPPDTSEVPEKPAEDASGMKRKMQPDPSTSTVEASDEPAPKKSPYFSQSSSQRKKGQKSKKKNDYVEESTGECKFVVSALKLVPKQHKSRRAVKKISYGEEFSSGNESPDNQDESKDDEDDDDDDDSDEPKKVKKPRGKPKRQKKTKGDDDDDFDIFAEYKRILKRDPPSENSPSSKKQSKVKPDNTVTKTKNVPKKSLQRTALPTLVDVWIEVYLMTMQKWITVELTTESINNPSKCESIATKPLQYVLGFDNDQKIKDITCRYAEKWLSFNRKLRIDREWWAHTLHPYKPKDDVRDRTEEGQLKKALLQQDFPKSISEFKDNPLYALKRHLLKYQAIYPESAVPLGYIRNEAIYSRDCVHELHTRETWRKQGRTVKDGEVPYKIVKGRPKRNTPLPERDNIKVEVFGLWQTEIYVPPPVVDGKVPKNEYGNVELFKPSMLPAGAIHLPMNNMQKIARKLNIDFAPAMMGWDFHGGWSHPVIEGIVVAKEYEDVLLDAWRQQEEEEERKEKEKREKTIYGRWKAFVKALLIREKLKDKYNFEDDHDSTPKDLNPKKDISDKDVAMETTETNESKNDEYSNISVSWPMNRMQGTTTLDTDGHVHIFPEENYLTDPDTNAVTKVCECGLKMPLDNVEKL